MQIFLLIQGGSTVVRSIDDNKDFKLVNKALRVLGFDGGEIAVSLLEFFFFFFEAISGKG